MGGAKSALNFARSEIGAVVGTSPRRRRCEGCDADGASEMTDGSVSSADGHAAAAMLQAMREADVAAEASLRDPLRRWR